MIASERSPDSSRSTPIPNRWRSTPSRSWIEALYYLIIVKLTKSRSGAGHRRDLAENTVQNMLLRSKSLHLEKSVLECFKARNGSLDTRLRWFETEVLDGFMVYEHVEKHVDHQTIRTCFHQQYMIRRLNTEKAARQLRMRFECSTP